MESADRASMHFDGLGTWHVRWIDSEHTEVPEVENRLLMLRAASDPYAEGSWDPDTAFRSGLRAPCDFHQDASFTSAKNMLTRLPANSITSRAAALPSGERRAFCIAVSSSKYISAIK